MLLKKVLLGLLCFFSIFSQSRQTDSLAMVAIYNAMGGSNWSNSWVLDNPINTWYGVSMSGGRVTQLDLYNRNLTGQIPSEIGDLSEVYYIRMAYDEITGSIPTTIGNLKKLTTLTLQNLKLTSIPNEIGRISTLQTISVPYNFITSLPDSIVRLPSLTRLNVYNNELTSLPDSIGTIGTLQYLSAQNNNLSSLPSSISQFQNIRELNFGYNNLTVIPDEVFGSTLTSLNVQNNTAITTIPSSIENAINLRELNISSTSISSFPSETASLTNLVLVRLNNLGLTSLPDGLTSIPNLETLDLSQNNFSNLPAGLTEISSLVSLTIASNSIEWAFPTDVYELTSLRSLALNNSNLVGSIPEGIDSLKQLSYLNLSSNQLTGPMPDGFNSLTKLSNLNLQSNKLTAFPSDMSNMAALRFIYLSGNEFAGSLPNSFSNLTHVEQLYLSDNKLDSVPNFTGTNVDATLNYLTVQNNELGFTDVINNLGVATYSYQYNPQTNYGDGLDTAAAAGTTLTLTAKLSHQDDQVQWYKNNQILTDSTNLTIHIDSLTQSEEGIYSYRLTNSNLPSLNVTSADYRVLIPDTVPPPTVSNFQAEPRNGGIQLTWNTINQSDFSMFYIYGEPTASKASTLIDSTTNTSYLVTGLINEQEYQFSLTAKDLWGNESTHTMDRKVSPDGIAPSKPTGLVATSGEGAVDLTWDAVPENDLAFYRVLYGLSANNLSPYTTSSTNFRTVNGLVNGQEYYFAVLAVDIATNEGDTSSIVSATPEDVAPPAPINVSVIPNNGMVTIKWDLERVIPDFKSYKLYMGESSNPTTVVDSLQTQYNISDNRHRFEVNDLTNNTQYFFRLKTFDTNGNESPYSMEVSTAPDNYRQLDSLALVQFYTDMNGESWTNAWNLSSSMNTWSGVTVENNRVTQLSLYNRNLSGKISRAIKDLPELTYFYLGNDPIVDSIPSEIGYLTKLTYLHIRSTEITYVPAELGLLTNLTGLYLRYNYNLTTIDASLENLDKLTNLNIYSNALEALPADIDKMAELTTINAYSNRISSLPVNLANSPKLTSLQMQTNKLSTLPANFENLTTLTSLNLSANEFTEFPVSIGSLTNLTALEFGSNGLTSVPVSIASMTKLITLGLSSNNISELPTEFSNLVKLKTLNLNSNSISVFPTELESLTDLENLNLGSNNLSGTFPTAILSMTNLRYLYLNNNNLTGSIPAAIGNLAQMNTFYANNNDLSGEIPDEIGNMSNLTNLRLHSNKLTGSIPESFGSLASLQYLFLNDNLLDGTMPSDVSGMVTMSQFYVYNNQLTGTLPSGLDALVNMDYFYVYNNKLSGAVPESIKNNPRIYYLYLNGNEFTEMPDLTGSPLDNRVYQLKIDDNKFGFDQIIKNVGVASSYIYTPQKPYGVAVDTITTVGQDLILRATKSHPDDQIQWYKNEVVIGGETADSLSFDSLTVESIARYTYRLTNSGASQLTLTSEPMNVLMLDTVAPANVSGLSVQVLNASVILNWNQNSEVDFDKFFIYQDVVAKAETLIDSTSENTLTINGLVNGTTYRFYITARDRWGNYSAARAEVDATPDGTAPVTPANFAVDARENSVYLTWDKNPESDINRYRIFRGTTSDNIVFFTTTTNTYYNATGLVNGDSYYFAVSAYDQAGNEGDTTAVLSATPVNLVPPQVTGLGVVENDGRLIFNWQQPSMPDFSHYVIYFGTESTPTASSQLFSNTNQQVKESLQNGTTYYFQMKVVDQEGLEGPISSIVSGIPGNYGQTDSLALVAMYNSLGGANWTSPWNLENPINTWAGISISNNRVSAISLYNRNLVGVIPNEVGDLTGLTHFDIGNDDIHDTIPSSIGNLRNLQNLYIRSSNVSGSIPESIGNLEKIDYLYLYSNKLSGSIPASFGNLVNMRRFYLYGNDLTGSIPSELGNLEKVQYFYLHQNNLSGSIPASLGNLNAVSRLYLYSNELSGSLPEALGDLESIQILNLQSNKFSGALPASLGNLNTLQQLYLQNNEIESIPNFTGTNLENSLSYFYLQNNWLEFDDVIPNVGLASNYFYDNQKRLSADTLFYVVEGESKTITVSTAAVQGNIYTWYKNNGVVANQTTTTLNVTNFQDSDVGTYYLRVTNPAAPNLQLYSGETELLISSKPDISTAVLQNPAAAKYADIVISADMLLKEESNVKVKGPKSTKTYSLTRVENTFLYKASHEFSEVGNHTITTFAAGESGLDSTQVRAIKITLPKYSAPTELETIEQNVVVTFTSNQLSRDMYLVSEEIDSPNGRLFKFGPAISTKEKSQIEIRINAEKFANPEKLFVYQKVGSDTVQLETKVFEKQGIARAEISSLGEFFLGENLNFEGSNLVAEVYSLDQNYPNPFNPVTRIPFSIKENAHVRLIIYNVLGQKVRTLVNEFMQADHYEPIWLGTNDLGQKVASGVYFYQLVTPNYTKTKKMLLIK